MAMPPNNRPQGQPTAKQAAEARLNQVLAQIEGEYFLDYALFTGSMREYTVRGIEQAFEADPQPSDHHRRMFMLATFREQYTAYEDLGAFLDGFLTNGKNATIVPLNRVMVYRPSEVQLASLFARFGIASGDDLYKRLDLESWVPGGWSATFPKINLAKTLRRMSWFFVADCTKTQRGEAVAAFNKLKHGLMFVPSARRFNKRWLDAPGVLIPTPKGQPGSDENPVTIFQIPVDEEMLKARLQAVNFVETGLRLLATLYVVKKYPDVLLRRNLEGLAVFQHPFLTDVMDIADQVANKPWEPSGQ